MIKYLGAKCVLDLWMKLNEEIKITKLVIFFDKKVSFFANINYLLI